MKKGVVNISGRECRLYQQAEAEFLLIQPVDEHDSMLLEQEVKMLQELTDKPFTLVAFRIKDWNQELTPWPAPPVFGKEPFGDRAKETLAYITGQLLPELTSRGINTTHCLLGGYSLAGLFALWAGYQIECFEGIVAASPSVWYPDWIDYTGSHKPFSSSVYLSLGDKEEKTKNPVMAQVGNCIRRQYELLQSQAINTTLEWNSGNHFVDSDKRMAKGFAWMMNK